MTTAAPLPMPSQLQSRQDPQAALRAALAKWTKLERYYRARGERTTAATAARMADGFRRVLTTTEGR